MSLFELFFGKKKKKTFFAELTEIFKGTLEPVLQAHFLNYQKKMALLYLFESKQIKSRDFSKRLKKLCNLPTRGRIGSFEKKEIAKILSLLNNAIDAEENPDIKSLEKDEQKLLADLSDQIDKLAENLQAQHAWLAENLSNVKTFDDVAALKELLIDEGKILYNIKEKDLPKIHAEIDAILHETAYTKDSDINKKIEKEKKRRKEWWRQQIKKGFVTLYHAYAKKYGKNPLVEGALLDPNIYPAGFYMAENDQEAVDAIVRFKGGKYSEKEINILRIEIQADVFNKLIETAGSEVAWSVYYIIPVENFDKANREIKRGFIRFSMF